MHTHSSLKIGGAMLLFLFIIVVGATLTLAQEPTAEPVIEDPTSTLAPTATPEPDFCADIHLQPFVGNQANIVPDSPERNITYSLDLIRFTMTMGDIEQSMIGLAVVDTSNPFSTEIVWIIDAKVEPVEQSDPILLVYENSTRGYYIGVVLCGDTLQFLAMMRDQRGESWLPTPTP